MNKKTILLILTIQVLFFIQKGKAEADSLKVDRKDEIILKKVASFIQEVLKENKRQHFYGKNDVKTPKHISIFSKKGFENVIAYSNKKYPKKIKPNYYEHFTLFVLHYQNQENAIKAYKKLKSDSKFDFKQLSHLDKQEKEKMRFLFVQVKTGGMIYQKDRFIFSLVKTCRETPIGGSWKKYENLFLAYLSDENEEIKILIANCGDIKYQEEKRKTSFHKN